MWYGITNNLISDVKGAHNIDQILREFLNIQNITENEKFKTQ